MRTPAQTQPQITKTNTTPFRTCIVPLFTASDFLSARHLEQIINIDLDQRIQVNGGY